MECVAGQWRLGVRQLDQRMLENFPGYSKNKTTEPFLEHFVGGLSESLGLSLGSIHITISSSEAYIKLYSPWCKV